MPIVLYHGLPGLKKTQCFFERVSRGITRGSALIVVPDEFPITDGKNYTNWDGLLARTSSTQTPKEIFITNFYPLSVNQREFLRDMKKNLPHITIYINYDEDFLQNDPSLQKIYEDLGNLADKSLAFERENNETTSLVFAHPFHEIAEIVTRIQSQISDGASRQGFALVLVSDAYLFPVLKKLFYRRIPASCLYPIKVKSLMPLPQTKPIITDDFYSKLKLKALENPELEFIKDADFNQIIVCTLDTALQVKNRTVFVLGCTLENACFKITLEKIKHLTYTQNTVILTSPKFDFDNKETTPIVIEQTPVTISPLPIPLPGFSPLPSGEWVPEGPLARGRVRGEKPNKKMSFSVSELQEYLTCPYRYYCKHELKLGALPQPVGDIPSNVKGSFAHRVLDRLIRENETTYVEGLAHGESLRLVFEKIPQLIQQEFEKDSFFITQNEHIKKFFGKRLKNAIEALITQESAFFRAGKKKTTPKLYEWNFAMPLGDNTITGRVDRVDFNQDVKQFTVIDYKTGDMPSLSQVLSAENLQLSLYLMAVKSAYPDFTPAGAFYYSLKHNEVKGFSCEKSADAGVVGRRYHLSQEAWEDTQTKIREKILAVIANINGGEFDPQPVSDSTCITCDYRQICPYHLSFRRTE